MICRNPSFSIAMFALAVGTQAPTTMSGLPPGVQSLRVKESLATALRNVTEEEAAWQPAAYLGDRQFPGMPLPGTILWQIAHLEHSARHYQYLLTNRPVSRQPQTPGREATDLRGLLAALTKARGDFRAAVVVLSEAQLEELCFDGMSVEEFLRMAIRHDTWHAGQIIITRRLYRERVR